MFSFLFEINVVICDEETFRFEVIQYLYWCSVASIVVYRPAILAKVHLKIVNCRNDESASPLSFEDVNRKEACPNVRNQCPLWVRLPVRLRTFTKDYINYSDLWCETCKLTSQTQRVVLDMGQIRIRYIYSFFL